MVGDVAQARIEKLPTRSDDVFAAGVPGHRFGTRFEGGLAPAKEIRANALAVAPVAREVDDPRLTLLGRLDPVAQGFAWDRDGFQRLRVFAHESASCSAHHWVKATKSALRRSSDA